MKRVTGSADPDVLVGTADEEIFDGGAGQDRIYGGAGDDVIMCMAATAMTRWKAAIRTS